MISVEINGVNYSQDERLDIIKRRTNYYFISNSTFVKKLRLMKTEKYIVCINDET